MPDAITQPVVVGFHQPVSRVLFSDLMVSAREAQVGVAFLNPATPTLPVHPHPLGWTLGHA